MDSTSSPSRHTAVVLAGLAIALVLLIGPVPSALADDGESWAAFRGPNADGIAPERGIFRRLPEVDLEVVWKRPIGSGYSAIAVAGSRAVTLHVEGESDVVTAFSTDDGSTLWSHVLEPTYVGHDGSHDGPISTPLIADGKVVALGAHGRLAVLDAASGEVIWTTHLVEDLGIPKPHYGFGTSPLLVDGLLILELGGEKGTVAGLDLATGEVRWTAGDEAVGYQTPIPWTFNGQKQLVAVGNKHLFGITPSSGEILWQVEHGGDGGRGIESLTPVPAGLGRLFLAHQDDASKLVEVSQDGNGFAVRDVWDGRTIRNSYNVAVHHAGSIFAYSARILTSVDAATGEMHWRSRQPGDGFMILVDGHLVLLTKTGSLHVAPASAEGYRELAEQQVFEDHTWSTPSYSDGRLFVRSFGEIARVDLRRGKGTREEMRVAVDTSSAFGRFLAAVKEAPKTEKQALVERFMVEQKSFPIVEGHRAHFIYQGVAEDVGLAGDMYGNRREEPMERLPGTDFFYRTVKLEADARLAYLFMVDYTVTPDPRNPRRTNDGFFARDLEMAFRFPPLEMSWMAMPEWREPAYLKQASAARRGRLVEHELENEAFGEKKIDMRVYLPKGYEDDPERRYPTLYVHGGSGAIEGGGMPNTLDNLFGRSAEPAVVVFFDIPAFGPDYDAAVRDTVVPFVDATYRTVAEAGSRTAVAAGFAATSALTAALGGELFGQAGIQSALLFRDMNVAIDKVLGSLKGKKPRLYVDWTTYDVRNPHEGWNMVEENRALGAKLDAHGIGWTGGEAHDGAGWSSWKNRTGAMLEALLPRDGKPSVTATGASGGE